MKTNNNVVHLPRKLSPLHDPVFDVIKNIERSYQRRKSGKDVRTGVSWLKEMTDGHKPQGFILVPGNPLLMRAIVFKASMDAANIPVALFSQMHRESIVLGMISLEPGIHVADLQEGRLRPDDWPSLAWAASRLTDLHVFIEGPGDVAEVCARARSLAEDFDIKAVFIDDLGSLCSRTDSGENPEATGFLRELSQELTVPIFAGLSE